MQTCVKFAAGGSRARSRVSIRTLTMDPQIYRLHEMILYANVASNARNCWGLPVSYRAGGPKGNLDFVNVSGVQPCEARRRRGPVMAGLAARPRSTAGRPSVGLRRGA